MKSIRERFDLNQPADTTVRFPGRREFLALGLGAFVVAAAPWAARRRGQLVRRSLPVMGTVAEIAVVHRDAGYAQAAMDAAFAQLTSVDRTMSRFRADSDIGRANAAGAGRAVPITPATATVLAEGLRWAGATGGLFDPALGRLSTLWDVGHRAAPPAAAGVRRLAGRSLYREVEIGMHGAQPVIVLQLEEVALDLGGIAKGYAVDRAVDSLRVWGIQHALVNAGGDLYALGRSPEDHPWTVGVRSPDRLDSLAATLTLEDRAVATSGDYIQFFDFAGRRYHHLIDPLTGEPRRSPTRSLTIEATTCMAADAAATALFGSPTRDTERILTAAAPDARIVHQM